MRLLGAAGNRALQAHMKNHRLGRWVPFYQKFNKEEQQIIEEEYHLRLLSLERRREYMGMPVEAHA